jgi:hypothetical protein
VTPAEFRAALARAGVSRPWLAAATGRQRGAVDRWCAGTAAVPPPVLAWLARRLNDPPPVLPPPPKPVPPQMRSRPPGTP